MHSLRPHALRRLLAIAALIVTTVLQEPAQARDVAVQGGAGGGPFRSECTGQFLAGINARAGSWIDAIASKCATFVQHLGEFGPRTGLKANGGNGGSSKDIECGRDRYISGIKIGFTRDDNRPKYLDYIEITCKVISGYGGDVKVCLDTGNGCWDRHPSPGPYNGFGLSFSLLCNADEAAIGIHGRSGIYVDAVGLICGPKPRTSTTPPPPPPPAQAGGCSGLSGEELAICNKHNTHRAQHGVPPLNWSADLAKNAQNWVNGCHTAKDDKGNVFFCHQSKTYGCGTDPNYKYGENLSWGSPSRTGVEAVDGWYCEGDASNYDYNNPKLIGGTMFGCDNNPNKVNGHFTQIVWKATKSVGCAKNTCSLGGVSGTLWACEYDPPGNFNADKPGVLSENVPRPIKGFAHFRAATKPPVQKSTTIVSDVDLYDQPGGRGKKIGILRKGQTLALISCRADNWCQVTGGWVWGSFIVRNHSRSARRAGGGGALPTVE
jgi:hypothetical protein